jgi:hypothetical protein
MAIANGLRTRHSTQSDYVSLKFVAEDVDELRQLKKEVKVPQVRLLGWILEDRKKLAQENMQLKKLIKEKLS